MTSVKHLAALLAAAACAAPSLQAQSFGTNILVNGDAESGPGVGTDTGVNLVIPGWTRPVIPESDNNLTAVKYGTTTGSGSFPDNLSPGPLDRGNNFFAGGPASAKGLARQTVDLTSLAAAIDGGGVAYTLSGFLGGYDTQRDFATFSVSFRDGVSLPLASDTIGPVGVLDRPGTSLVFRSASGTVPVGTRQLVFNLEMTRVDGDYNDGYADNLSFTLTAPSAVPEPSEWAGMAGLALAGFAALRRSRRPAA